MPPEGPERDEFAGADPEFVASILAARNAPPPFDIDEDLVLAPQGSPKSRTDFAKLKAARRKVADLNHVLRENAFDDWIRRFVVTAERPDEWTQARTLYENYLKRAKDYGNNRGDKRLSRETLASETQWGKMMGSVFSKVRRRNGWYYPLRIKKGA